MWNDAAPLIAELQRATESGGVLVIKIDNERDDGRVFTVVINGSKYGGKYFRGDGADLPAILRDALAFCANPA